MVPPAVAARDELILPSEQRMVRVRDSDGLTRNAGVRCSRLCLPRGANYVSAPSGRKQPKSSATSVPKGGLAHKTVPLFSSTTVVSP